MEQTHLCNFRENGFPCKKNCTYKWSLVRQQFGPHTDKFFWSIFSRVNECIITEMLPHQYPFLMETQVDQNISFEDANWWFLEIPKIELSQSHKLDPIEFVFNAKRFLIHFNFEWKEFIHRERLLTVKSYASRIKLKKYKEKLKPHILKLF